MAVQKTLKPAIYLFILGFAGVVSIAPLIPKLLALQPEPLPIPMAAIQALTILQSSVLLFLMVWLGGICANKVGLAAPVIAAIASSRNMVSALKPQLIPAIIGGIAGGILIVIFSDALSPYLPPDFIRAGEKLTPPWYTKILYGGITEEILVRWGLMSFFVWGFYHLTQTKGTAIKTHNYLLAIIVSALVFGAGHLPTVLMLSPDISTSLIFYIVFANAVFGFIAGYLYWKYGLESAIGAHMIAHLTMLINSGL
ncbi:CPBP family intramembrane glutamic endopeptidase [Cellvibrio sp. NN19]|uniref:CPBP family intramembrane glutamic endopeptidase n=1 Tax=Cellvibrio chitinivorans TaxID=3102792 RepID=UPI002B417CF5|nr:CPBP family intramembrane glutamic endopeptidase [Cellvibrio sp. NN19]